MPIKSKSNSKTRTRCPNGTRKNPVTKKCESIKDKPKKTVTKKKKGQTKLTTSTVPKKPKRIIKRKKLKCPSGMIVRDGYTRKGFTKKNGTRISTIKVPSTCIKSRGLPGKTRDRFKDGKGIGPLKKGELGKHGYHKVKELGIRKRRKALRGAVEEFTALTIFKKLGAIRTYSKNTNPEVSRIYLDDQ